MTNSVFSEEYSILCDLLVGARKAAGVTQEELATTLGRPQSFVSKYERGERRLDVIEFIEVVKALNADPAKIVRRLANR